MTRDYQYYNDEENDPFHEDDARVARETDCNNSYLMGFILPFIFNIFALFCCKCRRDSSFRRGMKHGLIIILVFMVLYIIGAIIAYYVTDGKAFENNYRW